MSHSWSVDAPTGVFKNHELSSKIRMASIKKTIFNQFVTPEAGYGKKKGESITITRVSNVTVPSSDVLQETNPIPEDTISISTQALTVSERGRAIPYTSLAMDLGHFDLNNAIQAKLMEQLKVSMDNDAATAFKAGKILATPTGVAETTFETDGAASTAGLAGINLFHVSTIRDYLFSTLNCAPYVDDDYMGIVITQAKRSIMNDPDWKDWHKYTDPKAKFNGEIGRSDGVRFIETNNTTALPDGLGTGDVLGSCVFFGEQPVVMGVVEDPHLRLKEVTDYGRSKGVAWYGNFGYAQIFSDSSSAGEARVVYVTSST